MCGRLDQHSSLSLKPVLHGLAKWDIAAGWDYPPALRIHQQSPLLVASRTRGKHRLIDSRWGMDSMGGREPLLHARVERLKTFWRTGERCAIPCVAWYDAGWRFTVVPPEKPTDGWPWIWLAGMTLYGLDQFTVVTRPAATAQESLCDRVPVPLDLDGAKEWIDGGSLTYNPWQYRTFKAEPDEEVLGGKQTMLFDGV